MLGPRLLGRRLPLAKRLQSRALQHEAGHSRPPAMPVRAKNTDSDPSAGPEVGWMWQTGAAGAGNKAGATRANLKQANIKAKK